MESNNTILSCPNCGNEINVSDVLAHQIEERLSLELQSQNTKRDKEYQDKLTTLQQDRIQVQQDKEDFQSKVDDALQQQLKTEKVKIEESIRKKVVDETQDQVKTLQVELSIKSEEVKQLNKAKADISRLEREKDELKDKITAESQKSFTELLQKEKEAVKKSIKDEASFEIQKRDKTIDDLLKRLEEATTKAEQGSSKISGEIKEIELKEFLTLTFPLDHIADIPSGKNGADIIHTVKNSIGSDSGTILYERKHTLKFEEKWISKLKEDRIRIKADIGVIVSKTMPTNNSETHYRDGVWVCTVDDLKILSLIMRDGLLREYAALSTVSNAGSKMEMLYKYLTSQDFKNHIMNILDSFRKMDKSLAKEKEYSVKLFAEREAHIFQAKQSVLQFYGRVDGIALSGFSDEMKMLETSGEQG